MTGVVYHGHATYLTQTAGTMSLLTIPTGIYGTLPTLVFATAATFAAGINFWTDVHTVSLLNGLGASVTVNVQRVGGSGQYAQVLAVKSIPTGFLDSGATLQVTLTTSIPPAQLSIYQDAGLVTAAVVSYDAPDVRDGLDHWYFQAFAETFGSTTVPGPFTTVPFLGGVDRSQNINEPFIKFNKLVGADPSTLLTVGIFTMANSPGQPGEPAVCSWAATNWTDIDASDATVSLNVGISNKLYATQALGLWTKPDPLDTNFLLSGGVLGHGYNAAIFLVPLNNDLPLAGGFVYAAIIG